MRERSKATRDSEAFALLTYRNGLSAPRNGSSYPAPHPQRGDQSGQSLVCREGRGPMPKSYPPNGEWKRIARRG
jgi:hypothetical protein